MEEKDRYINAGIMHVRGREQPVIFSKEDRCILSIAKMIQVIKSYQGIEFDVSEKPYYVYFVSDGKKIKIGKASNIERRICEMQTAQPEKITLEGFIETNSEELSRIIEKLLHLYFKEKKEYGEWFNIKNNEKYKELKKELKDELPSSCKGFKHNPDSIRRRNVNSFVRESIYKCATRYAEKNGVSFDEYIEKAIDFYNKKCRGNVRVADLFEN